MPGRIREGFALSPTEAAIQANLDAGMSPAEAVREAWAAHGQTSAEIEQLRLESIAADEAVGEVLCGSEDWIRLHEIATRAAERLFAAESPPCIPPPPAPLPRPGGAEKKDPAVVAAFARESLERDVLVSVAAGVAAWRDGHAADADRALAELRTIVDTRAKNAALLAPLSDEWAALLGRPLSEISAWLKERYAPAVNKLAGDGPRMCVECTEWFAPHDHRDVHCSKKCRDRAASRGRDRVGNGKSAVAVENQRTRAQLKRHLESCAVCKKGPSLCSAAEALNGSLDALDRRASISPEAAENMNAAKGRTRKKVIR